MSRMAKVSANIRVPGLIGNRETRAPLSPKYKDHGPALLSRFWLRIRRVYTEGWR